MCADLRIRPLNFIKCRITRDFNICSIPGLSEKCEICSIITIESTMKRTAIICMMICAAFTAFALSSRLFSVSNSHINKIIQDHIGYIWIATDNGLTCFDGNDAKTFRRSAGSPSLLNNVVLSVLEDSNGDIWVGTYDGIQRFDRITETFSTPRLNYPGVPEFTYVNSIIEDSKGNIWFTTSRSGVICFTADDRRPVCYHTTNSNICSDKTTVVFEDKFGNIWIGSNDKGVTVFNPTNGAMTNHRHNASDPSSLSGNMVFSIVQANDGTIYVASLDGGIDSYDYPSHRFRRNAIPVDCKTFVMRNDPGQNAIYIGTEGDGMLLYDCVSGTVSRPDMHIDEFDATTAKVHDIMRDRRGNVWAALYQKGILMLSHDSNDFITYGFNPFDSSRDIGTAPVLAITKTTDGSLWIATDGDGIYKEDHAGDTTKFLHLRDSNVESNTVMTIFQDSRGDIWAGGYLGGLSRYDAATRRFVPVRIWSHVDGATVNVVNTIAEDASGRLWLGTNGSGVCIYDPQDGSCHHLVYKALSADQARKQLCGNSIHAICFDHNGDVWIGSSDAGLSRYRQSDGTFEHFNVANRRLGNNCVYSIAEDSKGRIFVATAAGLSMIYEGKTTVFDETHGLKSSMLYCILPGDNGELWLSGADGILRFNPEEQHFFYGISPERLGRREFKRGAAYADASGRLYFGGVGGVVSFLPGDFDIPRVLDALEIRELSYRRVGDDGTSGLETLLLSGRQSVELNYDVGSLYLSFGVVEFNRPGDVIYEVRISPGTSVLSVPDGLRTVSLPELAPGRHTVTVSARLAGGPAIERNISLIVLPPFWLTWWAKILYIVIAGVIIVAGVLMLRRRSLRRQERRRRQQADRLMEDKLQFFTDISHEIRTPLTLVLGPIAELKKSSPDARTKRTFEMMENNGARILRMISQVIDLRKLDNDRMKLSVAPVDVRVMLTRIADAFAGIVTQRKITLDLFVDNSLPDKVWLDADKIDKVVFNVLSNALRFSPDGGIVAIKADIDGTGKLRIRISDSGPGIQPEYIESIFERFYRIEGESNRGGTGIGLHLSRKLMAVHHGSVYVEESSAEGTTFAIIVPMDENLYMAEERSSGDYVELDADGLVAEQPSMAERGGGADAMTKAYTILVVEDDLSILKYIKSNLRSEYNVIAAADGAEGLEAALRYRPHCIITDVMMPVMDGVEMCRRIRANRDICEIPVVMLTAKAADDQRMEGLEAGADDYITKPFTMEHLERRIAMLIHSRRVLKQKFTGSEPVNEDVVAMQSSDDRLLERVEAFVVRELANPDLTVELIASETGVSRSHLHRRLKALTAMSPSAYIKQARMRHAARLLVEKRMAVSEVAYATGFSSLSHFSTVFKEFYGMSPTRYVSIQSDRLQ